MRSLGPLLALMLLAPTAQAWQADPELPHHADLAERAARGLPPELREVVFTELAAFRKGALDPDGVTDEDANVHTFYHTYEPVEREGGAMYTIQSRLHDAAMAMREGKDAEEVAYALGQLTHFVTDLAVPFHTGDGYYDHEQHGPYETQAYAHQHADLAPSRPPAEVTDVERYMTDVAMRSAMLAERLTSAFERADGAWTEELDALTRELEQLSIDAAADMMLTAYMMADPARPAPTFDAQQPLPMEPEDLGLSLEEQWRRNPTIVIGAAVVLVALGIACIVAVSRRRERQGRRPL